jgi:bifunctional non-homologous end joining protein LigD
LLIPDAETRFDERLQCDGHRPEGATRTRWVTLPASPSRGDVAVTLETYRRKRRFDRTPEPQGRPVRRPRAGRASATTGRFVVQRHRARRLHYDVRLEIRGVLVSWAVPRGPSLDPRVRRLAVRVEDHPLEYFAFEGLLPRAEYGAGDVIVWDWGRWTADPAVPDAGDALARGELKVELHGEKLHGGFVFVRADFGRDRRENWLLIHRRDDEAVRGWDAEDHPESVKTGRTNDELAAGAARCGTRRG